MLWFSNRLSCTTLHNYVSIYVEMCAFSCHAVRVHMCNVSYYKGKHITLLSCLRILHVLLVQIAMCLFL